MARRLYRVCRGEKLDVSCSSLAPVLMLRRRLKSVACVPEGFVWADFPRLGGMRREGRRMLCVVRALNDLFSHFSLGPTGSP